VDLEPAGQTQLDDGQWELRANGTTAVSKIRDGDLALASDGNPITGAAEICRIARLDEDQIVVTADEPVELRRLDVYPPKSAPTECSRRSTTPSSPGRQSRKTSSSVAATPVFEEISETFVDNNDAQNEAVQLAVGAEDFALVHGPPGTGKTYTLAQIVRACV